MGFGGLVVFVGYMYCDFVDMCWWIVDVDYKEGLVFV